MKAEKQLATKKSTIALLTVGLCLIFAVVYYLARPASGLLPPMPRVHVDEQQMASAEKRLKQRAESVEITPFHTQLLNAFHELNRAEVSGRGGDDMTALLRTFADRTEIAQTARKERYLLFGDYLAVKFEKALFEVLALAEKEGMNQVIRSKPTAYQQLVDLSGNFLDNSLRIGLIAKEGRLNAPRYVPQILFRKRWRVLGEIPFQLNFLPIESLADAAYLLKYGDPKVAERRLKAAAQIQKQDAKFDADVAKALILYQAKESKRALLVLENARKKRPDDFVINEFHLFLSNDTK